MSKAPSSPSLWRLLWAVLLILGVIGIDQASKAWILYDLMHPPVRTPLFPFYDLVLLWNTGVGFGLLQSNTFLGLLGLTALSLGISVVLAVWLWRTRNWMTWVALGLIIGGAIGNIIDRFRFGGVLDFIYIRLYIFDYRFPAFNVADSAITIGAVLLLIENYIRNKDESLEAFRMSRK